MMSVPSRTVHDPFSEERLFFIVSHPFPFHFVGVYVGDTFVFTAVGLRSQSRSLEGFFTSPQPSSTDVSLLLDVCTVSVFFFTVRGRDDVPCVFSSRS